MKILLTNRFVLTAIFSFMLLADSFAQLTKTQLSYYLPKTGYTYDPKIPTPEKILGYMPGDQHVTHDQLYYYAKTIASLSPRFKLEEIGRTYENRPYILLIITSEENQKRLDAIKKEHLKLADPAVSATVNITDQPSFVWLGYSIHGNETSGSNASLLTLYHLAAAQGPKIDEILKNEVIFIDPSENPDGLTRFSGWINQHRYVTSNNSDPQAREHAEAWPGGRFNHYWFDLNRDWLPLQMPESKAKIAKLHEWKPNILIDEHEQGTNATFHVSPGEPMRVHPLIPAENQVITRKIAGYVGKSLDNIGSLYTSQEGYDDYYNGRGPTYLDFNGGIAMLFEQARSTGYSMDSDNGLLTFPFGVRNQFVGSLAVLDAGLDLRKELLEYQRKYFRDGLNEGKQGGKAYVFGTKSDGATAYHLAEVLKGHDIDIYHLKEDKTLNGIAFKKENSYVVPLDQTKYRLIQSIFEKRTTFKDSLFYDISGWTFPLAFNQDLTTVSKSISNNLVGSAFTSADKPAGGIEGGKSSYAYILEWEEYYAPKALYKLLDKGIIAKVANNPFTIPGGHAFARGSVLIPVAGQHLGPDALYDVIKNASDLSMGVKFYAIQAGSTAEGNHLGSSTFQRLVKPSVFTFGGGRVDALSAGPIWHLLDTRYEIPASLLPVENAQSLDISKYNTLILADGDYSALNEAFAKKLQAWVEAGNVIIAYEAALTWLNKAGLLKAKFVNQKVTGNGIYKDFQVNSRASYNPGSIVEITADLTHPLFYGYTKSAIPLYKSTNLIFADSSRLAYNYPARFSKAPLLSGYLPKSFPKLLSQAPAVMVSTVGQGRVIAFTDDTNFRAFWYGTNKMLANGIFFGNLINPGTGRPTLAPSAR